MNKDLRQEATNLGLQFSPNIGDDTLKHRIEEYKRAAEVMAANSNGESTAERRQRLIKAANIKQRVRISCLNTFKQKHKTVLAITSNPIIGTITEYIPVDVPWHITKASFNTISERKFSTRANSRGGRKLVREYDIEELPPLTPAEIKELAGVQSLREAN